MNLGTRLRILEELSGLLRGALLVPRAKQPGPCDASKRVGEPGPTFLYPTPSNPSWSCFTSSYKKRLLDPLVTFLLAPLGTKTVGVGRFYGSTQSHLAGLLLGLW
ncbi:hypothetical protein Hamer_G015739 [Homarus americanus]|uniref:Uncharacterized protein n=1 Tax=Homarus americanus TaxID=6706 RepID=A0A8J5N7G5_HOMAM|nr:hypothetical protein Hamer_G015739 [Homarus americanus]